MSEEVSRDMTSEMGRKRVLFQSVLINKPIRHRAQMFSTHQPVPLKSVQTCAVILDQN